MMPSATRRRRLRAGDRGRAGARLPPRWRAAVMVIPPGGQEKSAVDDSAKAKLDALLQGYEEQLDGRAAAAAQAAEDDRGVRQRFVALRETVIEPTMRELGEYLKARGHDYEIRSLETRDIGAGRNEEPSITLSIYPRGYSRAKLAAGHTPMVTFRAGDAPGRLRTHLVRGLPGGGGTFDSGHSYALEAVTPELVRREIMELLEAIMGRRGG